MNYENNAPQYSRRPAVVPVAFFTAFFTSVVVTVVILWLTGNLQSSRGQEPEKAPTDDLRKVPAVLGLTPEMAGDVLRTRELRLVVSEERASNDVPKGKIVSQEPLADSDLKAGGAVQVVVSSGVEKIEVPALIGETLEKAKELLGAKKLKVGKVLETGEGDPGTVTDVQPKAGTAVEPGHEITLTVSPSGKPVPKVVGQHIRKARKTLKEAGFKVGETRRRYNDNLDPNVVLSQDPAAETPAPPGTAVDLVLND